MSAASAALPRLKFLDVTLYAVVAAIGFRWLPVAAAVGPASLPLWVLAFFTFYIPLSVATVEMTSRFAGGGSLYGWTRGTFGPLAGFVCGWFYWISLFPYFAGIVYFLSGVILSAFGVAKPPPALFLGLSIAIIVAVSALQLLGLRFGKWFTNLGGIGTWLVFGFLVAAAAILLARGASATNFVAGPYVAPLNFDTAILWGTIVFAICGSETVAFLRNEIDGGVKTIVRVLIALGIAVMLIYMAGTAIMLVILPKAQLTRLSGLPDALTAAFVRVGFPSLATVALALFALSNAGGLTAWFTVATRLPEQAGIDNFLPPIFARRDPRTGAPTFAILLQAALTVVMIVLGQAGEGAAAAYDFLVAMSVLTTCIPYIFVFAAYLARHRWPQATGAWLPPGGARMGLFLGLIGFISTVIATACTLIPSGNDAHPLASFLKIVIATGTMLAVGLVCYWLGSRRARAAKAA